MTSSRIRADFDRLAILDDDGWNHNRRTIAGGRRGGAATPGLALLHRREEAHVAARFRRCTMNGDAVSGGCLCGAVRYRAGGEASHPTLCHCPSCRRAAGAPVVAWVTFPLAHFAFTKGAPARYRSSPSVVRTFCATCGTPLSYHHDTYADAIDVTVASLDDPSAFPPADHTWTSERIPWLALDDALPRHSRSRFDQSGSET